MKFNQSNSHYNIVFGYDEEKKLDAYAVKLQSSNLVEDIKFREIAKSKEAIQEIYVNLTAKALNEKMQVLFDIITKLDYYNKQLFPVLTETKEKYSDIKKDLSLQRMRLICWV